MNCLIVYNGFSECFPLPRVLNGVGNDFVQGFEHCETPAQSLVLKLTESIVQGIIEIEMIALRLVSVGILQLEWPTWSI